MRIKNIAEELNNSFDDDIIVVNVYDALAGALNNNAQMVQKSNLPELLSKLNELSVEWKSNMERGMLNRFGFELMNVQNVIRKRLHEMELSAEQVKQERIAEFEKFSADFELIENKLSEIGDYLDETEKTINIMAEEKSDRCVADIRKEMFRLIDNGIYDGEQLTNAFSDFQNEYISETMDDVINEFYKIKLGIENRFEEIQEIEVNNNINTAALRFENGDAFKFEKAFPIVGGIGGALIFLVLEISSAPILIAITVGASALGRGIGKALKNMIGRQRARKVKEVISPYIDELKISVKEAIINEFANIRKNIALSVEQYRNRMKAEQKQLENAIYSSDDIKSYDCKKLEDDLEYIDLFIKEFLENEKNI